MVQNHEKFFVKGTIGELQGIVCTTFGQDAVPFSVVGMAVP